MEYINNVEISGEISEIRQSERGTRFAMIKQIVTFGDKQYTRLFEVVVNHEKTDLINSLVLNKNAKITGVLAIFKVKKFNIHKMIIEATKIELLD
jgi:hypothetical protein